MPESNPASLSLLVFKMCRKWEGAAGGQREAPPTPRRPYLFGPILAISLKKTGPKACQKLPRSGPRPLLAPPVTSWAPLGCSRAPLGLDVAPPGRLLAPHWHLLACPCLPLGSLCAPSGSFGPPPGQLLVPPGRVLAPFGHLLALTLF